MKREVFHFSIEEAAPYIDWSYFLHTWGMGNAGKETVTAEELLREAHEMLKYLNGKYRTHAVFALCNAHSDGDNIIIEGTALPLLRQQHAVAGMPNLCLSDFVSPYGDKIGLFATSAESGIGEEFAGDDYRRIMSQALADRLAEATASLLHLKVRTEKELWGYAPNEKLDIEQLNREEYQGIRPAVGYPSLPDQSVIFILDGILGMKDAAVEITANGAMLPHASVSGIMLSHPAARYFAIGEISMEQLEDYCARRGKPVEEIKRFLQRNIKE